MGEKKTETFKKLKEIMIVSDDLKEKLKIFNKNKGLIRKTLCDISKSIPTIAEDTGISSDNVTYVLMSMLKNGEIEVDGVDDEDEYYFYKLKPENQNG